MLNKIKKGFVELYNIVRSSVSGKTMAGEAMGKKEKSSIKGMHVSKSNLDANEYGFAVKNALKHADKGLKQKTTVTLKQKLDTKPNVTPPTLTPPGLSEER